MSLSKCITSAKQISARYFSLMCKVGTKQVGHIKLTNKPNTATPPRDTERTKLLTILNKLSTSRWLAWRQRVATRIRMNQEPCFSDLVAMQAAKAQTLTCITVLRMSAKSLQVQVQTSHLSSAQLKYLSQRLRLEYKSITD